MDYKPLPIGISDFAEMIQKKFYYVDKTPMIKDLLDQKAKVTLFTRPRRFGKTLNMSMLKYFFEDARDCQINKQNCSYLFEGLKIMKEGEYYLSHMGRYPVICLTFKDSKRESFERSYEEMARVIAEEFERHKFILKHPELTQKKINMKKSCRKKAAKRITKLLFYSFHSVSKHIMKKSQLY